MLGRRNWKNLLGIGERREGDKEENFTDKFDSDRGLVQKVKCPYNIQPIKTN